MHTGWGLHKPDLVYAMREFGIRNSEFGIREAPVMKQSKAIICKSGWSRSAVKNSYRFNITYTKPVGWK